MFKTAKPLFLLCETPLHVGSGSDLGVIDLPIQRERHTDVPKVESSSLKGALREAFEQHAPDTELEEQKKIHVSFGYDEAGCSEGIKGFFKDNSEFSGCLGFTDGRLLLFPVKSLRGVFAWVTCPDVLHRFADEMKLADTSFSLSMPKENTCPKDTQVLVNGNQLVLEEYTYTIAKDENENGACTKLAQWLQAKLFPRESYWGEKIVTNLVVLSNDDFRDFTRFSTEVVTRTKIDNRTGTVAKGALFTEEFLPAESILYSLVLASPEFSKREKIFNDAPDVIHYFGETVNSKLNNILQLGGDATLGKGIMRAVFVQGAEK
jgi:CRISPR-associated protein Cmr4